MLSNTADYATRAVLFLARSFGGPPVHAETIADATGTPRNYMGKTLHALGRAGIVTGLRGPHGGFALAVAPEQLTLARVIDLFDEPRVQRRCMLGTGPCDPTRPCDAHHRWSSVMTARRVPLTETTFADLLGRPRVEAVVDTAGADGTEGPVAPLRATPILAVQRGAMEGATARPARRAAAASSPRAARTSAG